MIFKLKNFHIEISYYFLIIIAIILSTDTSNISLYFLASILIHELGHLVTILYYKVKINKISFKAYGIHLEIDYNKYLAYYKELIILLSGSLANFITCLLIYYIKLPNQYCLLISNLIIGIFNLLPVDSLDGGKIINIILFSYLPMQIADILSSIISLIFTTTFFVINFFFMIHGKFNLTLTVLCIILILKILKL